MPYFVVHAIDRQGVLAMRTENRPAHRARLRAPELPVTVHAGGPLLDSDGDMTGTMLIIEAEGIGDVEAFVAGDPYTRAGVYGTINIHAYQWGLGAPGGTGNG